MIVPALVPAAGRGDRMGGPKLLLPIGDRPLIGLVLDALRDGGAAPIVVVTPPPTRPDVPDLIRAVGRRGAVAVPCDAPTADMRATVEVGLHALHRLAPDFDAILLTPADCPGLSAALVARVLIRFEGDSRRIVIPEREGRRGHPVALPRAFCDRIAGLPRDVGINALLRANPDAIDPLAIDDEAALIDLDTPDDYRRWLARP